MSSWVGPAFLGLWHVRNNQSKGELGGCLRCAKERKEVLGFRTEPHKPQHCSCLGLRRRLQALLWARPHICEGEDGGRKPRIVLITWTAPAP